MAQKLMVDLEFRANTDAAKKQVQSLQQTLNQAINSSMAGKNLGITPQLEKARLSAMQLKTALDSATNVDTGRLNLHKFTNNLRSAGLDVQQLGVQLKRLGPDGMKAFSQMTSAMASAETKVFSLQGGLRRLVNTFANTVRYQASAFAIQAVTSSIQKAISYTKDLDKALTDIQIVTDKSTEDMQRFAVQANKAAKALSTTTTEYAKASQIYFQQGLDTGEAMKRAEITIKLAHATGDSMEEVSNWMTAIWNNFDNGTKTLEYYGDVLAKLGAATASSADEIAQGLEKFAAVAETVGLSYEYAASALATITAETRQSADVVGTALKTLFARIEGLKLGETLDDGTTLNQYSLALQTVGINIKDANGELKNMDIILDETANKWDTLAKDEQVALAQSVAGIRQYTQFIALMDNYDVMKNNIAMSKAAAGSLQEMQEKYENSIEGIAAKATASSEALISTLVDDDDIKNFYKAMTGIMDFATKLTKAFGGLEGILLMVATALMKLYQPQIATMFQNMAYSAADLKTSVGNAGKSFINIFRGENNKLALKDTYAQQQQKQAIAMERNHQVGTFGGAQASGVSEKIYELKTKLLQNEKRLTDEQKNQYQWQIQILEATRDTIREEEKGLAILEEEVLRKGDLVNAGIQEAQSKRQSNLSTLEASTLSLAEIATSPNAVAGMDKTTFADNLINKLMEARRAAQELGGDIKNMGFDDALSDVQMFKEGHIQSFSEVQSKIAKVTEEIARLRAVESTKGSSAGVMVDMRNLQDRSGALGAAKANVDNITNMAKGTRAMDFSKEGSVEQFGNQMKVALQDTQIQAEKLGLNIKNLGFEDALQDIENFVKSGGQGIEELIQKMMKFQSLAHSGINSAIAGTADNALVYGAAGEGLGEGLKDIDNIESAKADNSNVDKRADQAKKAVGKIDESKQTDKMKKAVDKLNKAQQQKQKLQSKGTKLTEKEQKQLQGINKSIDKHIATIQQEGSEIKKNIKNSQQYTNAVELQGEKTKEAAESSAQLGYKQQDLANNTNNTKNSIDQLKASLDVGSEKIKNFGTKAANFVSTTMSLAMGFNMVTNGVSALTTALGKGSTSFSDYLTAAMSLLPGLMQMIPIMAQLHGWIYKKIAAQTLERASSKKTADQSVQDSMREAGGEITEGMAGVAAQAGKGPAGWVTAAASLAMIIPIAAMIGIPIITGISQGNKQLEEEKLEENREVNSAAQEVGKTLNGLSEQVDTFKNLRESGESTISVLADMKKSLEDLDFQIDELFAKGANTSDFSKLSGLKSQLAAALDDLASGRITADEYQSYIDTATKEMNQTSTRLAMDTMKTSGTTEDRDAYLKQVGTTVTSSNDLMAQAEKQFHANKYSTAEEAQKAWADAAIDAALGPEYADADWAESDAAINQLMSYAPISVHRVINALSMFALNGAISNKYGQARANMASKWAGNNQSKLAYANNIDFSQDPSTWNEQYMQALQQGEEAKITQSAEKLGYNTQIFETYTDLLVDSNKYLSENNATAKQLAVNNLSLNKGLKTLSDSWGDISKVLRSGKRGTIEYAEALGEIKTSMEEAFGYAPSTEFIEANLGTIEELANGNVEVLDELQSKLAEDLVYNLDYKTAINGESMSPEDIRETLLGLLSQLDDDMDLELGQNASISQDYLDTLQAMLNSGQMTADELDKLMRAKGFEIEYDGWKEMPGPKSTVKQTIYPAHGDPYTQTIESEETLTVPIINGQAPDPGVQTIGNANSKATIKKSSSASAINSSIFEKADDTKKKIAKEAERYYALDKALERLEREYDAISEAKSRAFGQSHLDLLTQEIAKTHELANVTKEKLAKAEEFLLKDREALSKYGVSFDEYGNVANYDTIMKHFSQSGDEETYNEFKDALSQYEKTLSETQDLDKEIKDYANQVLDLKLEAIQYQVDVRVQLADDDLAYIEYQLEHLVDPAADAAKAIDLIGQKMDLAKSKSDEYRRGLELLFDDALDGKQLNALKSGDFSVLEGVELDQAQIDMIRDYRDSLLEENKSLYATREEFFETISSGLDSWNEQFSEVTDEVAFFASVIDTYKNVIDLVGRKNLGVSADYMNKLSQSQVNNSIAATKAAKEQLEFNKQALQQLKAERDTALAGAQTDEERARIEQDWKETIKTAEEEVRGLEETVQSSWTDALTAASEAFETSVNLAAEAFEEAMSGVYGTFDSLQKAFDRVITANERYVSDYTKIYELSKLNRNINKQIDNSDSVKAKTTLRELQEEINALQESETEMTQYDLEYLQKKYDLRLAEIALEEAQNAKTQVRMRRDSEGNWGYVYTADQGTQDAAQQNYEDKLYASQDHTQQRISDLQNQIVENERNMIEELKALPLENYEEEKQRVLEYYAEQEKFLIQQIETAIGNSAEIYKVDWEKYAEKTGYKISANEDWVDSWQETVLAQVTGFDSLTDYYTTFEQATNTLVTELSNSYAAWQTNIDAAFNAAGQNVKTFAQDAEGALNTVDQSVKNIIDNLTNKETGLGAKAASGFQSLINAVHDKYAKYEAEIQPYIDANDKIIKSLNAIIKKQGEVADVQSGYYGTVTVGGVTYRTADKYDTKEEAQSAASKMATDYITSAKAYNTDSKTNTYSNESLQAISNSVTTVDGLSGLNYGSNLQMVAKYVAPKGSVAGAYTPPKTAQPATTKQTYSQNTYAFGNFSNIFRFRVIDTKNGYLPIKWRSYAEATSSQTEKYGLSEGNYTWVPDVYDPTRGGWLGTIAYYGTSNYVGGVVNYQGADKFKSSELKPYLNKQVIKFDTGGYTGSWDSSGRIAMLHQKEIVLNAHDTENFLAAVNIVRDITKAIDLQALSYQHQLAQLAYVNAGGGAPQTVQQEVTIRAEFPNATDRYEIEAAFASLVNDAAQFANRKK